MISRGSSEDAGRVHGSGGFGLGRAALGGAGLGGSAPLAEKREALFQFVVSGRVGEGLLTQAQQAGSGFRIEHWDSPVV